MAFNGATQAPTAREGLELQEIQTSGIGLPAVNGEVKLKIFDPWSEDSLPPPTSSLLAVASTKGLLAAAGPNELVLTSTDKVRAALLERREEKEPSTVREFQPSLRIPRQGLAHVAFTADESALLVSAQNGGGVEAYGIHDIEKAQPTITISTGDKALRAMIPNPALEPELTALVALVTVDGELLIADLKNGSIVQSRTGSVLRSGVSCVAWSSKGRALVAGLADGTAVQLKPDGTEMALIPKLASMEATYYVSAISWLQNDTFFFVYAPPDTEFPPNPCEYYIIDREPKTTNYNFKKLTEPLALMGMERLPTSHFLLRLRNFPPSLTELLLVGATSSAEIGLITKAGQALSADANADDFASTLIEEEGRRAVLPLSANDVDTSPVGMALDFSSKELVPSPIPTTPEIDETSHAVPQLIVLNNEGLLCSWWIVYNESVLQKTQHPAVQASTSEQDADRPTSQAQPVQKVDQQHSNSFAAPVSTFGKPSFGSPATASQSTTSAFGKPSFGTPATNSQTATSAFGKSDSVGNSSTGAFGSGSAFGAPSTIGGAKSSWVSTGFAGSATPQGTNPAFGQPAFGSASSLGGAAPPAFGAPASLGKPSFGQPSSTPAFGNSGFGARSGGFGTATTSGSPFGAFAAGSGKESEKPASPFGQTTGAGFGSFAGKDGGKTSNPFGQAQTSSFGGFSHASKESTFGKASSPFTTAGTTNQSSGSLFNNPGAFKLQSSFKADETQKEDPAPSSTAPNGFGFGSGFGDILGSQKDVTAAGNDKEESMTDETEDSTQVPFSGFSPENQKQTPQSLVTPPSTIGQPKATPAPPVSSLFGNTTQQTTTPQPAPPSSTGWSFGGFSTTTPKENAPSLASTTPKDTPGAAASSLFGHNSKPATTLFSFGKPAVQDPPQIKEEPDDTVNLKDIPEAPLPPDTTSKPRYVSGVSSASSSNSRSTTKSTDAPLPPDWTPANKSAAGQNPDAPETSPLSPPSENAPLRDDPVINKQPSRESSQQPELPSEEDDLSDFERTSEEEDADDDDDDDEGSPIEAPTEEGEEHIATSPESSFKSGERSTATSPTGGLFTKVSNTASKSRPLFGEVGSNAPFFAAPKPQESPRSPSPVRNILPTDRLRFEASRSVSAPADPRSIIDQRKQAYAQSGLAAQAQQAQQQEIAREKKKIEEGRLHKTTADSRQYEELEDDEDERLREELQSPISASETLDDFVTYQPKPSEQGMKSGIPAQIERLYRDINSMVDTLGINSRTLSAYMKYQEEQQPNKDWPRVLASETPIDALNDEWCLEDTMRLKLGQDVLDQLVNEAQVTNFDDKLEDCQRILSQDIMELKMKFASIRKTLNLRTKPEEAANAPLSSEQMSLQHDLRVRSANVQGKLVQVEDALAVLRAKVLESSSSGDGGKRTTMFGAATPKKPTIEAVTNTVLKMTKMAEQKSADIDLLEAQLRKLDVKGGLTGSRHGTPNGTSTNRRSVTAASPSSSVYHTPNSKFGGSTRSTPARRSVQGIKPVISKEDKARWQAKAQRKKAVAALFKDVLEDREQKVAKR